jgi:hypothetical protein
MRNQKRDRKFRSLLPTAYYFAQPVQLQLADPLVDSPLVEDPLVDSPLVDEPLVDSPPEDEPLPPPPSPLLSPLAWDLEIVMSTGVA